jgi:hypothetical protein
MTVYVVTAHNVHQGNGQSYVVGVYQNLGDAQSVSYIEANNSGGEYECRVTDQEVITPSGK